jgi:hypothetical protein
VTALNLSFALGIGLVFGGDVKERPSMPMYTSGQSSLPTALTAVLQSSVNASARGVYA